MSSHFLVMLLLPPFTPCRPTYIFRSATAHWIVKPDTEVLTHHETVIEIRPLDTAALPKPNTHMVSTTKLKSRLKRRIRLFHNRLPALVVFIEHSHSLRSNSHRAASPEVYPRQHLPIDNGHDHQGPCFATNLSRHQRGEKKEEKNQKVSKLASRSARNRTWDEPRKRL
ncbi:hypothetical protein IWZ01DRAFT_297837 [Phyllosticta capitalensis]